MILITLQAWTRRVPVGVLGGTERLMNSSKGTQQWEAEKVQVQVVLPHPDFVLITTASYCLHRKWPRSWISCLSVCPPPPDCSSGRSGGLVSFLHSCDLSTWPSMRCRVSVQYIVVESMNEWKYSQIKLSLQVVLSVMGGGEPVLWKGFNRPNSVWGSENTKHCVILMILILISPGYNSCDWLEGKKMLHTLNTFHDDKYLLPGNELQLKIGAVFAFNSVE